MDEELIYECKKCKIFLSQNVRNFNRITRAYELTCPLCKTTEIHPETDYSGLSIRDTYFEKFNVKEILVKNI